MSYTGRYRDPGTVITITPQDYYVNDNHLQGTKTVTNMGTDQNGHLYYTVTVNGSLTAADGSWTATHQANRVRTWIQGSDTPTLLDDVYEITGSGSGVNRNGIAYTVNITNALRVAIGCPFITAGTAQVTPQDRPAHHRLRQWLLRWHLQRDRERTDLHGDHRLIASPFSAKPSGNGGLCAFMGPCDHVPM